MSVIDKLASSLNRRDEIPNQELAKEIVLSQDIEAVKVLVENLSNKKAIQNDCIKVLYEIGGHAPKLISKYINEFIAQLSSKNNRLQWGAMTALGTITRERPKEIYTALPAILFAADKGSVITKDHAMNILIALCSQKDYAKNTFPLLIEQLLKSPTNQLPMYAERAIPIINDQNKILFVKTLASRLDDIEKETKRKRVEKVIKKFNGQ
ncbi:hypothetical protein [Flagellimonas pacifica]|uniref:HEAT repeat domain-containing protein n=1 Tax=Flagellimonas pacifica TaxID=1247520 RepID=A0A285MCP0_9FLAO|nr:hypothetical protein [Allomuricauda parva]SNY94935.1 hypothetical protein SAMN06265377_0596 [Allomuricauda parva]